MHPKRKKEILEEIAAVLLFVAGMVLLSLFYMLVDNSNPTPKPVSHIEIPYVRSM